MTAQEFLKKYPCNRVLKAGKEYWGRYTLLQIMESYAGYKVNESNKSDVIKSGYCVCSMPKINSDENGFLFCDNCGLDVKQTVL